MDPAIAAVAAVAALQVPLYAFAWLIWRRVQREELPREERRARAQSREPEPPPGPTPGQMKEQAAELERLG